MRIIFFTFLLWAILVEPLLGSVNIPAEFSSYLAQIDSLRCGVRDNNPPYAYICPSRGLDGFDVELLHSLGDVIGVPVAIRAMPFDSLYSALSARKVDLIIGIPIANDSFSSTPSILRGSLGLFKRYERDEIRKIGLVAGFVSHRQLEATLYRDVEYVEVPTIQAGLDLLENKKIDGLIAPVMGAAHYLDDPLAYRTVQRTPHFIDRIDYALSVRKDNRMLLKLLNHAQTELIQNGKIESLKAKWLGKSVYRSASRLNILAIVGLVIILVIGLFFYFSLRNRWMRRQAKESQRLLDETRRQYDILVDVSSRAKLGLFCCQDVDDRVGVFRFCNDEFSRITGYDRDELMKMTFHDVLHPESLAIVQERYVRRQQGDTSLPPHYEIKIIRKGGEVVPLLLSVSITQYEGKSATVGFIQDISYRRKIENDLRNSEREYRELLDKVADGITMIKGEKTIYANKAYLDMVEYSLNEIKDTNYRERVLPIYHSILDIKLNEQRKATADKSDLLEIELISKSGRGIPVELGVQRITFFGESVLLVVVRDLSARRRIQEKLFQVQRMETLGLLAGGLAHDFNNILMAIIGYTSYIEEIIDDEEIKGYLKEIDETLDEATYLTRRLLTLSRQEPSEHQPLDVDELVKDVHKLVSHTIGENIKVEVITAPEAGVVMGDENRLKQALMNLCINARDAMPDGGEITISTENVELKGQFIESYPDIPEGDYVCIAVKDTGVGIPEEYLHRIFDPFFSTKSGEKGTGLGLAIVYSVAHNHRGFVDVESQPGQGTAFKLYLPQIETEITKEKKEKAAAIEPSKGETILFADDDENIVNVLSMLLERYGFKVLTAHSGEEVLDVLERKQGKVDLVVLDLVMPGLSGKETYYRIQELYPKMRVLFITGYAGSEFTGWFEDIPAKQILMKPFHANKLIDAINRNLTGVD